ncbi:MAG: protein translocase subunit SecF [Bacillota bacterium]
MDFIGNRKRAFAISGVLILAGLVSLLIPGRGLNLGIDFTGGWKYHVRFEQPATVADVRTALTPLGLGQSIIQGAGDLGAPAGRDFVIRTGPLDEAAQAAAKGALAKAFGLTETLSDDPISPSFGRELTLLAVLGVVVASILMVAYITWRFEFKFAITGIIALIHDVFITLGLFSLLRLEITQAFVAATLTIVGYSINDTIVVYDRIRDNMRHRKKEPLAALVNRSIRQSLTRTLNTSGTTLAAILAILVFGGPTTRPFAVALLVGVFAGTYSSIFIASPLWVMWKEHEERMRRRRPRLA